MDIKKRNSRIIVLYLYMRTFLNLLSLVLNNKHISNIGYITTIFLIIYTLYINNLRLEKKFFCLMLLTLVYMIINLSVVSYKYFVLVEMFSALTISFIPLYIITLQELEYEYLLGFWFKVAQIASLLFPIYILLYINSFIGYADIGYYSHINVLIMVYFIFIVGKLQISNIIFLIINIVMGLVIGSRMLFISSIVTSIAMIVFLYKEKNYKYYIGVTISGILGLVMFLNIKQIVYYIDFIITKYGIKSRNLYLFKKYLEGASFAEISAGRSEIYSKVLEYINSRSGLPGGLAVTRYLTNGEYYYSHNVLLDFVLIFGIVGSIIFTIWFIYKNYSLFKNRYKNYYEFSLYFMLAISFWLQSIVGAYFLQHKFFLTSIAILLSSNKRNINFIDLRKLFISNESNI